MREPVRGLKPTATIRCRYAARIRCYIVIIMTGDEQTTNDSKRRVPWLLLLIVVLLSLLLWWWWTRVRTPIKVAEHPIATEPVAISRDFVMTAK